MKKILVAALGLVTLLPVSADNSSEEAPARFWGNKQAYLQRQANVMFNIVDNVLDNTPPVTGAPHERQMVLANLDMLLHDTCNDNSPALLGFLNGRVSKSVNKLAAPVKSGYNLHKIYNAGFVAATPAAKIAFDIVRGEADGQHLIADSVMSGLVDKCDMLFVTHNHPDHGDPAVVEMFLAAGKPVVAPHEFMPDESRIRHIRPADGEVYDGEVALPGGKLKLLIFPGHQDELMNNLYVATTPDGYTFANIGDQYQSGNEDMEWIPGITPRLPRVDVLMFNCWNTRIPEVIEAFNPVTAVSTHENEMGHTIDHREAFWLTFQKLRQIERDYVVMGWGECFARQ